MYICAPWLFAVGIVASRGACLCEDTVYTGGKVALYVRAVAARTPTPSNDGNYDDGAPAVSR